MNIGMPHELKEYLDKMGDMMESISESLKTTNILLARLVEELDKAPLE